MNAIRSYAQLVRLPNLPSALADVCLGALACGALPRGWLPFVLLLPASACLYSAGMVFNDWFDRDTDRRERPERPLPSGRITPSQAARCGSGLLAAGVLFALLAGMALVGQGRATGPWLPVGLSVLLVGSILLYDGCLKHGGAGPVAMGACRSLNVLLGVSTGGALCWPQGAHLALVVGLYIAGVTWFARTEARISNQAALKGAAALMFLALAFALSLPALLPPGRSSFLFPYLLVAFGFILALPVSLAISAPTPGRVQVAVRRALMGLVFLDATLATALVGNLGLVILVLMVPSLYLNRKSWLYAT